MDTRKWDRPARQPLVRQCVYLLVLAGLATPGCERGSEEEEDSGPAAGTGQVRETDLATVRLTPEEEARVGVQTAVIEVRPTKQSRVVGGEVVVPPGRSLQVSAPLAGTLSAPPDGAVPSAGGKVTRAQVIFQLKPVFRGEQEVLEPADRINLAVARAQLATATVQAEGEAGSAKVQVEAAKLKVARADQLRREAAGSVRASEEAAAELHLAEARLEAAQHQVEVLKKTVVDTEAGGVTPLPIVSPLDGVLRQMMVGAEQAVAAGTALFEVAAMDPVWVKVPLYAGDLDKTALDQPAGVSSLGDRKGERIRPATPVTAPPSANANSAAVDVFYELANPQADLVPGQKVGVTLTLKSEERSLTIPFSAILYDATGGTWVYESTEPQVYRRRRVEVSRVADGLAVLAQGPPAGSRLVTAGGAELFGTEFGGGK